MNVQQMYAECTAHMYIRVYPCIHANEQIISEAYTYMSVQHTNGWNARKEKGKKGNEEQKKKIVQKNEVSRSE